MNKNHLPLISVLMPVYNAGQFLVEAIESILDQSYDKFEFIIIDDGSTDSSKQIIEKYSKQDNRIKPVWHKRNKGLIYSLNEAVAMAQGGFVARMDADDIAEPTRLQKQYEYLEKHKTVGVLATRVRIIDEDGQEEILDWDEDKCITYQQIKKQMPLSNCIAHPSVMMSSLLLKKYRYRNQLHTEDVDLWLRMLSDGIVFEKLPEKLLDYRVHTKSVTQIANSKEGIKKQLRFKKNFLLFQLKNRKWRDIEKAVLKSYLRDLRQSQNKRRVNTKKLLLQKIPSIRYLKQALQGTVLFPRVIAEKPKIKQVIHGLSPTTSKKKKIVFVLSWLTLGGADIVALEIIKTLHNIYEIHIITTESELENTWVHRFRPYTESITHLPDFIKTKNNKTSFIAEYCKHQSVDCVVISNSPTGYEATPKIRKKLPTAYIIDILHAQGGKVDNGGTPAKMAPYDSYFDKHITVTNFLKNYLIKNYSISSQKIVVIHNGVDTDFYKPSSIHTSINKLTGLAPSDFTVSWIGRFSYEKKPEEFLRIASRFEKENPGSKARFVMAGVGPDFDKVSILIEEHDLKNITLVGAVEDSSELLAASGVIVMTSEMEGLPIVLLEAGAMGVPAISTGVGGVPEYIKTGLNGWCFKDDRDFTNAVVKKLTDITGLKPRMDRNKIREYTIKHFSLGKMTKEYKELLENEIGK